MVRNGFGFVRLGDSPNSRCSRGGALVDCIFYTVQGIGGFSAGCGIAGIWGGTATGSKTFIGLTQECEYCAGLSAPRRSTAHDWTASADAAFLASILRGASIQGAICVLPNPDDAMGTGRPVEGLGAEIDESLIVVPRTVGSLTKTRIPSANPTQPLASLQSAASATLPPPISQAAVPATTVRRIKDTRCQSQWSVFAETQPPTESVTHFLVKLVFAAPLSFLSAAAASQAAVASVSHFFMKLVFAAPASFLSADSLVQVGLRGVVGCCA